MGIWKLINDRNIDESQRISVLKSPVTIDDIVISEGKHVESYDGEEYSQEETVSTNYGEFNRRSSDKRLPSHSLQKLGEGINFDEYIYSKGSTFKDSNPLILKCNKEHFLFGDAAWVYNAGIDEFKFIADYSDDGRLNQIGVVPDNIFSKRSNVHPLFYNDPINSVPTVIRAVILGQEEMLADLQYPWISDLGHVLNQGALALAMREDVASNLGEIIRRHFVEWLESFESYHNLKNADKNQVVKMLFPDMLNVFLYRAMEGNFSYTLGDIFESVFSIRASIYSQNLNQPTHIVRIVPTEGRVDILQPSYQHDNKVIHTFKPQDLSYFSYEGITYQVGQEDASTTTNMLNIHGNGVAVTIPSYISHQQRNALLSKEPLQWVKPLSDLYNLIETKGLK